MNDKQENHNSNDGGDGILGDLHKTGEPDASSNTRSANASCGEPASPNEKGKNQNVHPNGDGADDRQRDVRPVDPFDPMNLGISTDFAATINAQASTKTFELRKPNDQEYVRTSLRKDHRLVVGAICDKQDMNRVYVVSGALLAEVKAKYPKAVRVMELVVTQTLAGAPILWPVPLGDDRGGKWNSSHRAGCDQAQSRWTNLVSGRGQYDCHTVANPREVDWDALPPFREILEQAVSERFIDSMDHPLLRKLRGEIE